VLAFTQQQGKRRGVHTWWVRSSPAKHNSKGREGGRSGGVLSEPAGGVLSRRGGMGVWVGQRSGVLSRAAPAASSHGGEARRQRQWQSNDKRAEHQLRELVNTCSNTVAKLMLQSNIEYPNSFQNKM